jgi:type IV pilus assembly protein PilX
MKQSRSPQDQPPARNQQGAVLIVALIFMLLLTILAIGASGRSLLQERMAGSLRNAQQAQMSAETALRGAEWKLWLTTSNIGGHLDCLNGVISSDDGCVVYNPSNPPYGPGGDVTTFRTSQAWLSSIGHTYTGPNGSVDYTASAPGYPEVANNPKYIIEDMGPELPQDSGTASESGDTGPLNGGAGTINLHVFRITARATGGNPNAVRVVQSTFDAQANN